MPLHASIQEHCRAIGYDNLAPIIWHKIANAKYESEGNGGVFLGKPYEPNAVIKNDIEFILMERKHGGYRSPDISSPGSDLFSILLGGPRRIENRSDRAARSDPAAGGSLWATSRKACGPPGRS
jgi:hypothetical protein